MFVEHDLFIAYDTTQRTMHGRSVTSYIPYTGIASWTAMFTVKSLI